MAKISIPKSAVPAFLLMADRPQSLDLIAPIVESIAPDQRTTDKISKEFSTKSKLEYKDARKIVTQLLSLHQVREALGVSEVVLFEKVLENIRDEPFVEAQAISIEKFVAARSSIERALSPLHPLAIVEKASRLRYEHSAIFHQANILTDIRPVFDDSGGDLEMLTIGYMLEINYSHGSDRRQLFAALDVKDVIKLKVACDRALTKTVTLKEKLKALPWPMIVSGEIDDD